jgi:hypothetical protein
MPLQAVVRIILRRAGKNHHSTFCDTEEYSNCDEIAKVSDDTGTGCY